MKRMWGLAGGATDEAAAAAPRATSGTSIAIDVTPLPPTLEPAILAID